MKSLLQSSLKLFILLILCSIGLISNAQISTFPHTTTFASGFGDWNQSGIDNFNWTQTTLGTPSSGTGPQSSFGANGTTGYAFTESSTSSGVSSGDFARLFLNYDLTSAISASMDFYYYCYSATGGTQGPGTLRVNVFTSTDNFVTAVNQGTIWTNTSSSNSWRTASIDLSAYVGLYVQLQIESSILGWQSDNSIDEIVVDATIGPLPGDDCANAIDLASLTSPYSSTTTGANNNFSECSMSSSEDLIFYYDLPNGYTIDIGQTVNGYDSRHRLGYGSSCPGTEIACTDDPDLNQESWTNTTGTTQRVYWIQAGYTSNDGTFTLAWTVSCPLPSQPSAITGTTDPVPGASETYSVTNVSGVTYTWSFPSGWVITSGQGTNSVDVTVGSTNGTISCTPAATCGDGTARTLTTSIPNYRAALSNISFGSSTWCNGESRDVTIDVQNTGVATWNTTYNTNLGVKWNHWSDYHVRTSTDLAPGASQTYTLTIEGKDATQGPAYTTDLDGTYTLQFDLVNEASCWFANNSGSCGPGNSVATSSSITHTSGPTSPSATVDGASSADICPGGTVALVGSATGSSITTNSTSTNSTAGAIIDNTDLIRTIAISGTNADANELISLELNLTHTFTGDLDITLQAPNGSTIILSDDNGGTGENYTNTVFSTSGGSIISGSAPFTGTYTPEQAFSNLTGSADGTWTLNIYDDAGGDTGNFANFSITIPATSTSTVTYSWSLDGGTTTMTTGTSATSDALNSNSTITMTATDDGNSCTSTATASVTVNGLPSNSSVAISSPSSPPKNSENLSAIISTTDPESATVYSENDWRVDGTSFAVQNLSFDADGSDGLTSNSSQGGALTAYGDATQVSGIKGQAYEFDGVNDYLQNASVNIDPSNGLSISLWQYTITTASSSGNDAYHQWVNLGPGQQMVLRNSFTNGIEAYVSTGGNLTGWCSGCGTGDFIYLTNQVSAGSWNHWVVTWNPDRTFKLYKNGTLIKTNVAAEGALSTITSLSISGNSAENFNGKIDELLIFERDISADQVTALYNSGTPSYSTIADDETSCGESWTMSSSPVDAAGCQGSATLSSGVTISGAQVATADVTDYSTTCGVQTYDIAIDDLTASGSWEVSPASAVLFNDPTSQSTTITIDPTQIPSQFNQNLTLTWNPTDGNCASDNCSIRFSAPSPSGSMDTDSWVWGGLTNTTWSESTNWYKWSGVQWIKAGGSSGLTTPDTGDKIYVLSTSDVCVSNNLTNAGTSLGDVNIQSGGSFDLGSTNTSITGNITNDGTMQGGTGTVTLSGSTDQTISGTGTINFNNLTVNKSSGSAIISTQTDIRNTLTMTKGNIVNSQPVVIGVNSSSPGTLSHASGIVTGELRRYFANATGSTFFPVGTSSNMRDVTINFIQPPGTDEYLTVSYLSGAPTLGGAEGAYSGLPLVTSDNQLIQNYSADGHWNIDPTGGLYESTEINNANYEMTLHCKALSIQPTDVSKVRIIKSAGSENSSINHVTWTGLDLLSSSGIPADFTITAAAQGFSKFGAGSDDGNALPVELVSFNGSCNDGVVDVTWTTASEYNSSHFELENSRDGITWYVVYTKDAAGQSTELIEYTYNDVHANGGDNYYRLTQVDIDGTSKTYDVINASCSQTTSGYFSIYPNPSSGSFKVILNNAEIIGDARMNIVDTKGNIVLSKSLDVKSGINMYVVNADLAPGIYYVSVQNGDKVTVVLKHSVK